MLTSMLGRAVTCALALPLVAGCQELKSVEVANPCRQPVTVLLWETPMPRGDPNDEPKRVDVQPREKVEAKEALADVGDDGSSAEIVSGPGQGEVIFIPHGERFVIVPGEFCSAD